MQCQVIGSALDTALRFLSAATVGARTTLPILSHILLDAQNGQLRMAATNLNFWLEWTVAAQVDEPGRIAVAGKEWRALVSSLDDELVHLEAPDEVDTPGRMLVRFGKSEYHLPILPAEEFPVPTEAVWGEPFEVDGTSLAQAVRKVLFAASSDPTMGIYTGVHWRKEKEQSPLDIVATDTHRMALVTMDLEEFPPLSLTLPPQPLKVVLPLWEKVGTVRWQVSEDRHLVAWEGDQWKAIVTTLTGTFPNYRRVIPTEWAHEIVVKVGAMLTALRRMVIFRPTNKRVPQRVILRLRDEEMEMVAIEAEFGSYEEVGREVIPIAWRSEPTAYEIAFQHPYLAEFLSVVREGEVVVRFQESNMQASVWQPLQDDRYRYIVMPMHLPGSEGF
ncbi:MAG: hypothetical protein KEFWMYNX_001911 [Candidatus Fervidibacter sp.]|jgi:DNA polymerase III, beta subunit